MKKAFTAGPDDAGRRLESVLRRWLPHQTLAALHRALRKGDIRLNGRKIAPEYRVQPGDEVLVWQAMLDPSPKSTESGPILPRSWVLFENSDYLVVNKPSGILVHQGSESSLRSEVPPLDEQVRSFLSPRLPPSLGFRPGPLHRLDRETSGIVVFSASLSGAQSFSLALAEHRVVKTYLALVRGTMTARHHADAPLSRDDQTRTSHVSLEGQIANTEFIPIASDRGLSLVQVVLGTGRTHQIRAHAASIGFPLAGDAKYGGGERVSGLSVPWFLHAWKLQCELLPPLEAPLQAATEEYLHKNFKFRR